MKVMAELTLYGLRHAPQDVPAAVQLLRDAADKVSTQLSMQAWYITHITTAARYCCDCCHALQRAYRIEGGEHSLAVYAEVWS